MDRGTVVQLIPTRGIMVLGGTVKRKFVVGSIVTLALAISVSAGAADHFDLIYVDHVDAALNPCSRAAQASFVLLVNTGRTPITYADLNVARLHCTSSTPALLFSPSININPFEPLQPHEALGVICRSNYPFCADNTILLSQLRPNETLRDTNIYPFIPFALFLSSFAPYEGPASFKVTMDMAGQRASFTVTANISQAPDCYSDGIPGLTSAGRVKARPINGAHAMNQELSDTPRSTTWGRIKTIYR